MAQASQVIISLKLHIVGVTFIAGTCLTLLIYMTGFPVF